MLFQDLGISEPLLSAVAEYGSQEPTAVQSAVIPEVLGGRDAWVHGALPASPVVPRTGGIKGRRMSKKDKLREAAARARSS